MSDFNLDLTPTTRRVPKSKSQADPIAEAELADLLFRIKRLEDHSEVYAEMLAAAEAKVRARMG